MLDSIEFLSQSGVKFDFNNHTHVSIGKVGTLQPLFFSEISDVFEK